MKKSPNLSSSYDQ